MNQKTGSRIVPSMRYRDAPAAIAFLCKAFGFERHVVYEDKDGSIAHAQLVFGNSMIMLGSASNGGDYDRWVRPPQSPTAATTQGIYVIVPDCDAHFAVAKAGGATIVRMPTDEDYGGRGYTCRDPEGHVWSFGTYDPWGEARN